MTEIANDRSVLAERKARFWETTDYDRAFRGSFGGYMTDVEAAALDRLMGDERSPLLLDLGCGHGRFLRWLAPAPGGWSVSTRAGACCRSPRVARRRPAPVPCGLLFGSAQEIPLADASVDRIACVRVLQHLPDQDRALAEVCRVLKPGGTLILVQYNWVSPHGLIRAAKLPVKAALRRLIRLAGREPAFDEPTKWTSSGALRRQVESAGLAVERVTGAWLFPLQYCRSRRSNDAWPGFLPLALALEKLADTAPFSHGGYLLVRCRRP